MTNESNKAETIKEEKDLANIALKIVYEVSIIDSIPEVEMDHMSMRKHMKVDAIRKFLQEYSSIQQEEFRQQLDMWLSPENSKYYWEIVKIIESLNTK